jgi:hypothetical protein
MKSVSASPAGDTLAGEQSFIQGSGRRGDRGNLEITLSYPPERAAGEFNSHRTRRSLLDLNVLSGKATEID